ncbi:MAG: M18 family aminopeptidase [Corallococcus sp.]|nr:M18 family aminopeptidase [Corallococcus sp.]
MELKQFLNTSLTAYHTTKNVCDFLQSRGFVRLEPNKQWNVKRGGKYFVTRNGSSVIAFNIGKENAFNICECHTDSPSFKIKGNKLVEGNELRLNTEKYGGGLLYTFFDRPLKIAGRIMVEKDGGIEIRLAESDYNVVIPSLAIHHNPSANDGFSVNPQSDTLPLFAESGQDLYSTLAKENVLDADLYVVPAANAFTSGVNGEFLCSARLDNLTSAYACMLAISSSTPPNIAVAAFLDNEETGSGTRQGSPSFLEQTLSSLCFDMGLNGEEKRIAIENGMALSVDNGHAYHPAHPEKADPVNKTVLNGGVVIKHNVNYATDGLTSAVVKKLLKDNGIKYQDYYNRSDLRCGSTLGLATSSALGIKVCDIGIAQLAMHSACETCGTYDIDAINRCLATFLSSSIVETEKEISVK